MTSKGYRSIFLTLENAISDGFVREKKILHLNSSGISMFSSGQNDIKRFEKYYT